MNLELVLNPKVLWFLIGVACALLEFFVPGFFFIFFSAGAFFVGAILMFFNASTNVQIASFLIVSIFSLIVFRSFLKKRFFESQNISVKNDIDNDIIGQTGVTITELKPGKVGRVEFRGTQWDCSADENIKKGTKVKIITMDSLMLTAKTLD